MWGPACVLGAAPGVGATEAKRGQKLAASKRGQISCWGHASCEAGHRGCMGGAPCAPAGAGRAGAAGAKDGKKQEGGNMITLGIGWVRLGVPRNACKEAGAGKEGGPQQQRRVRHAPPDAKSSKATAARHGRAKSSHPVEQSGCRPDARRARGCGCDSEVAGQRLADKRGREPAHVPARHRSRRNVKGGCTLALPHQPAAQSTHSMRPEWMGRQNQVRHTRPCGALTPGTATWWASRRCCPTVPTPGPHRWAAQRWG